LRQRGEVCEDGRVRFFFRVLKVARRVPRVGSGGVDVAVDEGGVGVVGGAASESFEGSELGVFGADVVADEAAPGDSYVNVYMFGKNWVCCTYQNLPCLKAVDSNAVTIPKLLEPPLRASHKSGYERCVALTMAPDGKTTCGRESVRAQWIE